MYERFLRKVTFYYATKLIHLGKTLIANYSLYQNSNETDNCVSYREELNLKVKRKLNVNSNVYPHIKIDIRYMHIFIANNFLAEK